MWLITKLFRRRSRRKKRKKAERRGSRCNTKAGQYWYDRGSVKFHDYVIMTSSAKVQKVTDVQSKVSLIKGFSWYNRSIILQVQLEEERRFLVKDGCWCDSQAVPCKLCSNINKKWTYQSEMSAVHQLWDCLRFWEVQLCHHHPGWSSVWHRRDQTISRGAGSLAH